MNQQGNKVEAKHQVRRDGAKQVRVDALLHQIDEPATIAFSEPPRQFALLVGVGCTRGRKALVVQI